MEEYEIRNQIRALTLKIEESKKKISVVEREIEQNNNAINAANRISDELFDSSTNFISRHIYLLENTNLKCIKSFAREGIERSKGVTIKHLFDSYDNAKIDTLKIKRKNEIIIENLKYEIQEMTNQICELEILLNELEEKENE